MIHNTLNVGPWRSPEAELSVLGDVTGRRGVADWSKFDRNIFLFCAEFQRAKKQFLADKRLEDT